MISRFILLVFIGITILFIRPPEANAGCSCSPNGTFIGIDYIAQNCPAPDANDDTVYYFVISVVNCSSGSIAYYTSYGDTFSSPKNIATYWKNQGYRVLRNGSGTHIFVVMPYYQGQISGVNVSGLSAGIYTNSALDKYCLNSSVQDTDGDGYPVCFDCVDENPQVHPGAAEICDDGIDNDCNGEGDCADPVCFEDSGCSFDNARNFGPLCEPN